MRGRSGFFAGFERVFEGFWRGCGGVLDSCGYVAEGQNTVEEYGLRRSLYITNIILISTNRHPGPGLRRDDSLSQPANLTGKRSNENFISYSFRVWTQFNRRIFRQKHCVIPAKAGIQWPASAGHKSQEIPAPTPTAPIFYARYRSRLDSRWSLPPRRRGRE